MPRRPGWWAASLGLGALVAACSGSPGGEPLPRGAMARVEFVHRGALLGFGPFVGYYFRPVEPGRFDRMTFVCRNEGRFYSSDAPEGATLFVGDAILAELPGGEIPPGPDRIRPVFFSRAPAGWLATRPGEPFRHFHSCHDGRGPVRVGYWLAHRAVGRFTYDMGGRVGPGSPLYHRVEPGVDLAFPAIVEFDAGPERRRAVPHRPWQAPVSR